MSQSGIGTVIPKALWCGGVFLVLVAGGLVVTYIGEIIAGTTKHGVASQLGLITFLCGVVFVGFRLMQIQLNERRALKELTYFDKVRQG